MLKPTITVYRKFSHIAQHSVGKGSEVSKANDGLGMRHAICKSFSSLMEENRNLLQGKILFLQD